MSIEVMKQALEVLEDFVDDPRCQKQIDDASIALRKAIQEEALRNVQRIGQEIEQEPVATLEDLEQEIYENTREFVSRRVMDWMLKRYYTHPPQRTEQNFCPRCGKRTNDIHTCTPPRD